MWRMQVRDLSKRFAGETLFSGLEFTLFANDRMALVGDNGSGKSTLLRMILGDLPPDGGEITFSPRRPVVAHLPQELPRISPETTVRQFVRAGAGELVQMQGELTRLERELAENPSDDVLARYSAVRQRFDAADGYTLESRVERVLGQVQLPESHWDRPVTSLSGGERTRLFLARLQLLRPDLLLLDEPTNNLDWPALHWMEEFFSRYSGTILYVSHDREFLTRTAARVAELSRGDLTVYDTDYPTFRAERRRRRELAREQYEKHTRERRRLQQTMQRQKQWAERAHRDAGTSDTLRRHARIAARKAKAVERRLQRDMAVEVEKPWEKDGVNLRVSAAGRSARAVAAASDLVIGYGREAVARDICFALHRGERLAVLGANGTGKSTLLATLRGALPELGGELRVAGGLEVFVLEQEMDSLPPEATPEEWLVQRTGADRTEVRTALGCLELRRELGEKPFGQLSRGQRVRAALAQLVIVGADLIILDEPTNHLDLDSRETVEDALHAYPGTLIFASHDRFFVRRLADRILDLDVRPPEFFRGGLREYEERASPRGRKARQDQRLLLQTRAAVLADRLTAGDDEAARREYEDILRRLGEDIP